MSGGDPWEAERPDWWTKDQALEHLKIKRPVLNSYLRTGRVRMLGTPRVPLVNREDVLAEYRRRMKADHGTRFRRAEPRQ